MGTLSIQTVLVGTSLCACTWMQSLTYALYSLEALCNSIIFFGNVKSNYNRTLVLKVQKENLDVSIWQRSDCHNTHTRRPIVELDFKMDCNGLSDFVRWSCYIFYAGTIGVPVRSTKHFWDVNIKRLRVWHFHSMSIFCMSIHSICFFCFTFFFLLIYYFTILIFYLTIYIMYRLFKAE